MTEKEKSHEQESGEDTGEILSETAEPGEQEVCAEPEENELARVKSRLAYLAAEFDNYRKRAAREKEAIVSYGNERVLLAILPFLDNLERAIAQSRSTGEEGALLSGVRMTYDQILAELRKFGLEPISAVGELFDPNLHEAIARVPWEGKPEGTVLDESRKGYLLNGRLLRPSQVTVAHGAPESGPHGRKRGDGHGGSAQGSADGET
jgi:molecular chaperone GrpE